MIYDDYDELLHKSEIMVFYPTAEEFSDFTRYVQYMEEQGAHEYGIAKIVPPEGWSPYFDLQDNLDKQNIVIKHPVLQQISSTHAGVYQQMNIVQDALSLESFEEMALSSEYGPPQGNLAHCEERYWKGLPFKSALYGADVAGSLYDKTVKDWNIRSLGDVLDTVAKELDMIIPGVNTPYLYFGMWKTSFPWHVEDMDLYSINYLHYGEPKFWYAIPPSHARRFETMLKGVYPDYFNVCPQFLRHKMTIVSPKNLARNTIPVNRMVQRAGEFMVTFPNGYHSGFNMGYNAAESINFALHRWVEIGKRSQFCVCFEDTVSINMDDFIDKYNEHYDKNVEKPVIKLPQRKPQKPSEEHSIRKMMKPLRKLCDYQSANNTRAIARKIKFKRKLLYKRRRLKRNRAHDLIKKHKKRAMLRNIIIDPLPELDIEIQLEDDCTEYCSLPFYFITRGDKQPPKLSFFPPPKFLDYALSRIENDFTLRAENVPLRENRTRHSKTRAKQHDEFRSMQRLHLFEDSMSSSSREKHESDHTISSWEDSDSVIAMAGSPVKQPLSPVREEVGGVSETSPVPKKRKPKKKSGTTTIDLDVPNSLLSPQKSSSSLFFESTDSGLTVNDIFSEIVEGDLFEKENRRRSRKNKGGRPRKYGFDQTISASRLAKQKSTGKHKGRPVAETQASLWDESKGAGNYIPADLPEPQQLEQFVNSLNIVMGQQDVESSNGSNVGDEYLNSDISYLKEVEVEDSSFSDWRLMLIQNKAKLNKVESKLLTEKKKYLRKKGKPTFGSHGPSLNQAKVKKMNEELTIANSNKRNLVKLKDLIIYDKKFISACRSSYPNRDKLGRVKIQQPCAVSNVECMRRITWIFDHNYTVANTSSSPSNIVTVPVGDGRYKVVKVYSESRQTKSFTGRSFVSDHAKWPTKLLSMGHNIMAIFNYQAYSQTGFTFDDTSKHPEPSAVRNVPPHMFQKMVNMRANINETKKAYDHQDTSSSNQVVSSPNKHDNPSNRGKRKLTKPPNYQNNNHTQNVEIEIEKFKSIYHEIFSQGKFSWNENPLVADGSYQVEVRDHDGSHVSYRNHDGEEVANIKHRNPEYNRIPTSQSTPKPVSRYSTAEPRVRTSNVNTPHNYYRRSAPGNYIPDMAHVQAHRKNEYSGYDPKYVFASFDFDEPDSLPATKNTFPMISRPPGTSPYKPPNPHPYKIKLVNNNQKPQTKQQTKYDISENNTLHSISNSVQSDIDNFGEYINQFSALTTHKVMPDHEERLKRRTDRLWTVPNPLDTSNVMTNQSPPLPDPRVEKTIEWSLKRRNVDSFRVWPSRCKNKIWTPKDPPDSFSRTGLRVVQSHEYYNPNRYSRIQPCIHGDTVPNNSVMTGDMKRKEEQRKFREQQINNIPMLKDPRLLPTNNALPVNDLSSYYKKRIVEDKKEELDPVDVMEELFRRGTGPPNSGIRPQKTSKIADNDDSDPFKFRCSNFTKSTGTKGKY